MSTSETPPLFLLPPCLLSSSSPLPLANTAPGTVIKAPPASAAADPVRKPRREVSDLLPFSSRYARSLKYLQVFTLLFWDDQSSGHISSSPLVRAVLYSPSAWKAP